MSWSLNVAPGAAKSFPEKIDPATITAKVTPQNPDALAQAQAVAAAAIAIVESGALGGPEVIVGATLAGHADPRHRVVAGQSHDTVSLNLWQIRE